MFPQQLLQKTTSSLNLLQVSNAGAKRISVPSKTQLLLFPSYIFFDFLGNLRPQKAKLLSWYFQIHPEACTFTSVPLLNLSYFPIWLPLRSAISLLISQTQQLCCHHFQTRVCRFRMYAGIRAAITLPKNSIFARAGSEKNEIRSASLVYLGNTRTNSKTIRNRSGRLIEKGHFSLSVQCRLAHGWPLSFSFQPNFNAFSRRSKEMVEKKSSEQWMCQLFLVPPILLRKRSKTIVPMSRTL